MYSGTIIGTKLLAIYSLSSESLSEELLELLEELDEEASGDAARFFWPRPTMLVRFLPAGRPEAALRSAPGADDDRCFFLLLLSFWAERAVARMAPVLSLRYPAGSDFAFSPK